MRTVTVRYNIVGRDEKCTSNVQLGPYPGSKHETTEADIPKILAIFNGVPVTAIIGIEVAK